MCLVFMSSFISTRVQIHHVKHEERHPNHQSRHACVMTADDTVVMNADDSIILGLNSTTAIDAPSITTHVESANTNKT